LRWLWAKLLAVLKSITKVKANILDMIEPSVPSVVFETEKPIFSCLVRDAGQDASPAGVAEE
jgi:hypothetical protein